MLDVGGKGGAVDAAGDGHARADAVRRQRRQQRDVVPVVARDVAVGTDSLSVPGHSDEHSEVWVLVSSRKTTCAGSRAAASSRHCVRAASSRSVAIRDFFSAADRRRARVRDMVAVLRRTPVVASHVAQCSASVASGVAATCASSAASSSGRTRRCRPVRRPRRQRAGLRAVGCASA